MDNLEKIYMLKAASEDLKSIWNYTSEKWGKEYANNVCKEFFKRSLFILENPDVAHSIEHEDSKQYYMDIGTYKVFYRVTNDHVILQRLLYKGLSSMELLFEK